MSTVKPRVTSFAPQFLVDDLERSIAYYLHVVRVRNKLQVVDQTLSDVAARSAYFSDRTLERTP